MRRLELCELDSTQGGILFDCGLAAVGMVITAGAILAAPPVGILAGALGVGGLVGGMVGLARSCRTERLADGRTIIVANF